MIFKKKNGFEVDLAERGRDALVARKVALEAKLVDAERALTEAIEHRRKTLLEDDLDVSDGPGSVRDQVPHLRDERDAIAGAVTEISNRLTIAEERVTAAKDKVVRVAAAKEIAVVVDKMDAALTAFDEAARVLIPTIAPTVPLCLGFMNPRLVPDVEALLAHITTELRNVVAGARGNAQALLAGAGTVITPAAPLPPAPSAPPAIERRAIYTTQHIRWTEPDGEITAVCEYSQAHPPIALADRAIAANLALALDTPYAQAMIQAHGQAFGPPPRHAICVDLDRLPEAPEVAAPEKTSEAVAG